MNSFIESVSNHEILELSEYEAAFDTNNPHTLSYYSQPQTNNFGTNETPEVNLQNGMDIFVFFAFSESVTYISFVYLS